MKSYYIELAAVVLVSYIISIGAHEMVHVVHVSYLGIEIKNVCMFGVGYMGDDEESLRVINGWVTPNIKNHAQLDLWEANREISEYNAYLMQGAVLICSFLIIHRRLMKRHGVCPLNGEYPGEPS